MGLELRERIWAETINLGFIRTGFAQESLTWLREREEEKEPNLERVQHLKAQQRKKNQPRRCRGRKQSRTSYHRTKGSKYNK